jgi:non-heme chloroperoxidase
MPYLETPDGTDIYFKDQGEGAPVILIHGWPLNADMWEKQALFLVENGYRVISYDRRGFGRSDQPITGHDYTTLAGDLAELIDQLDLTGVTLIGFSMGGGEVVRYLSQSGSDRVRSAVLVSSIAPFLLKTDDHPDGVPAEVFETMETELRKDRFAFLTDFFPKFYGRSLVHHTVSEAVLDWTFSMAIQGSYKATLEQLHTFSSTDLRAEMASITIPVLVIHGTSDTTIPAKVAGEVAAKLLPNARYLPYEGEPHGLILTAADRLNQDLFAFLQEASTFLPASEAAPDFASVR